MIIYRYPIDCNSIPENIKSLPFYNKDENYQYFSSMAVENFQNYTFIKLKNYWVYYDIINPNELKLPNCKGVSIVLEDGNIWNFRTLLDMEYKVGYDPEQDKIIKIIEENIFTKQTDKILQKGEDVSDEEIIDVIISSLICNYALTKELVLYLQLLSSKNIPEIINKIFCLDILGNKDFFCKSADKLQTG